jgi:predicted  nucleic acid-binding Zn-ribbon protein
MTPFNGYHIQNFNQRVKSLTGDGKIVFDHKEVKALQAEILELLLHIRTLESQIVTQQTQEVITVEMFGKPFK